MTPLILVFNGRQRKMDYWKGGRSSSLFLDLARAMPPPTEGNDAAPGNGGPKMRVIGGGEKKEEGWKMHFLNLSLFFPRQLLPFFATSSSA